MRRSDWRTSNRADLTTAAFVKSVAPLPKELSGWTLTADSDDCFRGQSGQRPSPAQHGPSGLGAVAGQRQRPRQRRMAHRGSERRVDVEVVLRKDAECRQSARSPRGPSATKAIAIALADYWAERRRKAPLLPIGNDTLRLYQAQRSRCPLCHEALLPDEDLPQARASGNTGRPPPARRRHVRAAKGRRVGSDQTPSRTPPLPAAAQRCQRHPPGTSVRP